MSIDYRACLIEYIGHSDFKIGSDGDVELRDDGDGIFINRFEVEGVVTPSITDIIAIYDSNPSLYGVSEEYHSWDSQSENWIFDLSLYKNYIINICMTNVFNDKLNSIYTMSDGFQIKPAWKELYITIASGLTSCSQYPLGTLIGVNQINSTFTVLGIILDGVINVGEMLRVKNSTGNDGFYSISSKEIYSGNTIFTVTSNINSDIIDGDIYNDFCYIRSADAVTYKLVTAESIGYINSQLFPVCNRLYQNKHIYENNIENGVGKEEVDSILDSYINS